MNFVKFNFLNILHIFSTQFQSFENYVISPDSQSLDQIRDTCCFWS